MAAPNLSSFCLSSVEVQSNMNSIYGALLIGTFVGLILYGLSVHQLYRYFRLYPKDLVFVRSLVMLTIVFETMHTVLTLHACYFYLVDNYNCPGRLKHSVWSINLLALSTGVIMFITQMFFARRLYKVGPGYRIAVFLTTAFLAGEFAFAIAATVEMSLVSSLRAFWGRTWLLSVCYGMAMVADTILTIGLISVLQRSRTGMQGTDSIIDVLIVYAINTGLATGVFNVISLVLASVVPRNFLYLCFNIITAKLYANTLLAAVNSRAFSGPGGLETFELDRVPKPNGILAPGNRTGQWDVQHERANCSSVLNIKAATEANVEGVAELGREAASDDEVRLIDSKRSSTVVGHPFAVQLPASPHASLGAQDVKSVPIME